VLPGVGLGDNDAGKAPERHTGLMCMGAEHDYE